MSGKRFGFALFLIHFNWSVQYTMLCCLVVQRTELTELWGGSNHHCFGASQYKFLSAPKSMEKQVVGMITSTSMTHASRM